MTRRQRFVRPEVDRLALSDGDWIEVRHKLDVGTRRGILSRAARGGVSTDGSRVHLDGAEMAFARVEAYLLAWSFVDFDDKPVKLTPSAIKSLDPETFSEIEDAIDAHETAVAQTKNSSSAPTASPASTPSAGESDSAANSVSASASAGPIPICSR